MISVELNTVDISSYIKWNSIVVDITIDNQPSSASFEVESEEISPAFDDDIAIYDGTTKIFGGKVIGVSSTVRGVSQISRIECVDHQAEMDRNLASMVFEDTTVEDIIADLFDEYAPDFTYNNITGADYEIQRIVFNQVPLSNCLKRLAEITSSYWYISPDKDLHYFPRFQEEAPFNLDDDSGNYVFRSLTRRQDGSQVVNRVKVRGGDYNGDSYTDIITVVGDDTKSFTLPYKFANLQIWLSDGLGGWTEQAVGVDFIDDFTSDDVLYNFQDQSFRFENALSDGDQIKYTGNPKVPVLAVASSTAGIKKYGVIEKLVRDDSIESNVVARKRAAAELLSYAEEVVDVEFTTYTSGLRAGMLITASSTIRGFEDDLIIKRITFSAKSTTEFLYRVQCISTQQFTLIDLLRKIVEPAPRAADAEEVAEEIFDIQEEVLIADSWNQVASQDFSETLILADSWEEIDTDDLEWVYGPYFPTSHSDVKRVGVYNRGAYYH